MAETGVMEIADVREAIEWQAQHAEQAFAPCTARVIRAELAILDTDTATGRRMTHWHGLSLADALPLRVAGGLHWLYLAGEDRRLEPVYAGLLTDQNAIDAIVADMAVRFDARLLAWLDGPPQTNEAGRSAGIMAGLLWLSQRLGPRFELNEIGASAGVNTMMGRYFYDLGGVTAGPSLSRMKIVPEWRGPPPPHAKVEIVAVRGCDVAPVDLTDPDEALRLKAYVWADARERMARLDTAIAMAERVPPELVQMDAADFVREMLAAPQEAGVTRALFHTVMWQYLPAETQQAITAMMEEAGARATLERPLAWLALETNRQTFRHELRVRYWPGGEEAAHLAEAHPHGAWVEWFGK
ncbi:DUF2332 family protein [Altererythrobacter soli]|uniref:DUF2332 family protein n=1 Tax=Croceibacterium soli TaxID=1739690 RepID=A0A6I4UVJ4_9SPHN|nr:DUF2332 domain-containing protein [Croceibacterium soli]MXP41523.1 DUF2332 family protein [Croceibacterium soli]